MPAPCLHRAAHPFRTARGWGRALGVWLVLLAALPLAQAAEPPKKQQPHPRECFACFEAAWQAGSAARVVGCMDPDGELSARLYGAPFAGRWSRMKPAQARRALAEYLEGLRKGPALRDVTPKDSPAEVRLYEFTYRAAKSNETTTLLSVAVTYDAGRKAHVLASIAEKNLP